ncbi:MAG: hypothetical protein HKN91_16200, partial [Acidimicrobiia bacterium]|nr:hypothetical protein [Acidimicrobiia bacterium]
MSAPTDLAPPPSPTRRRWLRDPKVISLIGVGVPTVLIALIMAGFVGQVQQTSGFPYFSVDFGWPALLTANTPTGGDMGAHVLVPSILRDDLLPQLRLIGWSNDWYAGFPALYFYFPLPAVFTIFLDVFLPYGVAFKITASLGVITLPLGAYVLARGIGYSRVVATITAATASMYVFMESFSIFGGNIKSTMAGEFSFAWSLSLSLMYIGTIIKDTRNGGRISPLAAILLALTALSHVVTTMVVVVVSLPLLVRRRGGKVLGASWLLGFAIAAIWALPFLMRAVIPNLTGDPLTTDMGWNPVTGLIGGSFAPGTISTPLPNEFIPIFALALIGIVWSLLRRDRVAVPLVMMIVPAFVYWIMQLPGFPFTAIYNGRFLPYWFLGGFIFAGIAIGLGVTTIARWVPERSSNMVVGVGLATVLLMSITVAGIHDVPGWVRWNYSGYEGKDVFPEYEDLMQEISRLPDGRVMWEANSDLGRYGTPMSLMLTPYWSDGHPSMEGLLFESSLTTPFHFLNASEVSRSPSNPVRGLTYRSLNFERAVNHLGLYDVSYYVAWTNEAKVAADEFGLELVAVTEPLSRDIEEGDRESNFEVFRLPDAGSIDIATVQPTVFDGDDFFEAALTWYDDVANLDRWLVADGPESWPRASDPAGPFPGGALINETGQVSNVEITDHRISFRTTAIGVPHLVKVSYFPNWQATGA